MKTRRIRPTHGQVNRLLEDLRALPESPVGDHLTADEFTRYAMDMLEPGEAERLDRHLASCESCLVRLEQLLATTAVWQGQQGQRRMAELRHRALASPSLLERLRQALAALTGPRLAHEPDFSTPQPEQEGASPDGLVRWSLSPDLEEPGNLVLFLWSDEPGLLGVQIQVKLGAWERELTLERFPWDPGKVGGQLIITKAERRSISGGERPVFKQVEPGIPTDDDS